MAVMARRRQFDADLALEAAVRCFHERGYRGASIDTLCRAMRVGRGSLYAAFRGKHDVFEMALRSYAGGLVAHIVGRLECAKRPRDEIRAILRDVAALAAGQTTPMGCLVTNTAAELGGSDERATSIIADTYAAIEDGFYRALRRAQARGELDPALRPRAAARFLVNTIQGIRIMGRALPDAAKLGEIVQVALRCLDRAS
jgi:TetR/AcrR family transcriptional repressor of nem operon